MTFDGITVRHAALDQASGDLAGTARRIRSRLDQLESDLDPLAARWSGQAQSSYSQARAAWDVAISEMVVLLEQVSGAVAESNQAYRDADRRGAQRFS